MIKIENQTEENIMVYSKSFCRCLKPGEKFEVDRSSLDESSTLFFRYSAYKNEWVETDCGFERGGLHRRLYFQYEKQTYFPMITALCIHDIEAAHSELTLISEDISLRKLLLFKTVCLKRISCGPYFSENKKQRYMFSCQEDKTQFLKLMRIATVFTFPAAVLALIIIIGELLSQDTWIAKFTVCLFLLGFAIVALEDFYYTLKDPKWLVGILEDDFSEGNTGDGSLCCDSVIKEK